MVNEKQITPVENIHYDADQALPKMKDADNTPQSLNEQNFPRSVRIKGYILFFILGKYLSPFI